VDGRIKPGHDEFGGGGPALVKLPQAPTSKSFFASFFSKKEALSPSRVGLDSCWETATLRESRGCQHTLA
jgi:hypothetical protein